MPGFGWRPDPPKLPGQTPDHSAVPHLAATAIPHSASVRQYSRVLDQGDLGSCVANAGFQAVLVSHGRQGVANPELGSRLMGWYLAKATHGEADKDTGTFLRAFFDMLNKFGFCPESKWPYDVARFAEMPPAAAFRAAFDQHSPTVYQRINSAGPARGDDIKRAIAAGYAVAFGTLVANDIFDLNSYSPVPAPIGKPIAGGHALCVVGYEGDAFEIINSWGKDFCNEVYCWFSLQYMEWEETTDLWIVQQAPRYSE
jgi:C1A family cysteine protease